jgi:cobalt/nickel transport system permease protein
MHIPDGFLDLKTCLTAGVLSCAGLGAALAQLKKTLPPRGVPYLGLGAAFVFSAQMVNFPVAGGTSGHLIGSALVTALLGAPAAVVVLCTVLMAQAFIFADGGIMALGANAFNMAILAPAVSAVAIRVVERLVPGVRGKVAAVAFAGWCSTVAASLCCAGQLAWSGTVAWRIGFPAMVGIHALIGFGEGLISAVVLASILRKRPELLERVAPTGRGNFLVYGLLASLGIAVFAAPFACTWPDGLDSVAAKLGFEHKAVEGSHAWLADYRFPGIHSEGLSIAIAGLVGSLLVFFFALGVSRVLVKSERPGPKNP